MGGCDLPWVVPTLFLDKCQQKNEQLSILLSSSVLTCPPNAAHIIIRHPNRLIGPLFLYHPESEFSAVCLPMSSRLAANSLAISFGVLSPSAL